MAEQSKTPSKFMPFVSANTDMKEFTVRALVIGLIMCVVLGAANAYLGLKAGMTIAATLSRRSYRYGIIACNEREVFSKKTLLVPSAQLVNPLLPAQFPLFPHFYIAGICLSLQQQDITFESTFIMLAGGVLGIMFVALLRRVMVEDVDLPFPESVAASEIHKAGRAGGTGAKFLFTAMGFGALVQSLGQFKFFATSWEKFVSFPLILQTLVDKKLIIESKKNMPGGIVLSSPGISPAYIGVGYIIGPKLASLNFSGGLLAWGLFVPIITYFLAPNLLENWLVSNPGMTPTDGDWIAMATSVWRFIVRPIAIGGMLVSAGFTLFRMRKSLIAGISRSISDVKKQPQVNK